MLLEQRAHTHSGGAANVRAAQMCALRMLQAVSTIRHAVMERWRCNPAQPISRAHLSVTKWGRRNVPRSHCASYGGRGAEMHAPVVLQTAP